MKYVLLIRHLESDKNIRNSFSSIEDNEPITNKAKIFAKDLFRPIISIVRDRPFILKSIYCSNSTRAIETATSIKEEINCDIIPCSELNSIRYKSFGVTEDQARISDPIFISGLQLYRNGLLSSYDIETPEDSEKVRDFECRVIEAFNNILSENTDDLLIIISHRSPITAILLDIARKYYNYPISFFGYIPIDLGHMYVLNVENENVEILCSNEPLEKFPEIIKSNEHLYH